MQEKPHISVILPVYNAEKYLPDCLENLLNQTYANLEIIAIDDYSSDASFKILKRFQRKDKRLHISRNVKHYGRALTLNRCLKKTKGIFIAFMNAKDVSHPDRLNQQWLYLQANQKVVAAGVQCMFINEADKLIGKSDFPMDTLAIYKKPLDEVSLLFDNIMVHRHRIPKDVLHFKTNKYPFIYTDIIMKLFKYGEVINLPQVLYTKRKLKVDHKQIVRNQISAVAKIWFRSIALYDHMPSFRSLFLPPQVSHIK